MNGSRKNSVRGGRLSFSEKVQRGRPRDSNLNRPQSQGKPSNEDRQETRSRFSRDSSIIREQSQGKYSNEETQHSRSRLSSHSSVSSSFSANALPIVMSTPKRNTRQSNIALDSPTINKSSSNLSMNDSFTKKKFHKNYDPDIELRQVNERLSKRNSKSWADQSLLNDEQDEDLQKYSDKVKRGNKNLKLIQDTEVLARRQADIDKGKVKQCYRNYVYKVNKTEREPHMPRTPNKFIEMSRRAWDGMVRKWKKHIHAWNEPAPKKARLSDGLTNVDEYQYGLPPFIINIKGANCNICVLDVFKFFEPLRLVAVTMNFTNMNPIGELIVEFATESDARKALLKNEYPLGDRVVQLYKHPIVYDYGHKELSNLYEHPGVIHNNLGIMDHPLSFY